MKIKITASKTGTSIDIEINGDISLKYSQTLYKELTCIKNKYTIYNIRLTEITNIDISGIQIIYSYIRHLNQQKKQVVLDKNINETLNKILDKNMSETLNNLLNKCAVNKALN